MEMRFSHSHLAGHKTWTLTRRESRIAFFTLPCRGPERLTHCMGAAQNLFAEFDRE